MANVWGYWDCKYCSTPHIRGDAKVCPNCGHPVDKDVHYYLDKSNLEEVEKEKENKEADWICGYCGDQNTATAEFCKGCGSARSEATHGYFNREASGEEKIDNFYKAAEQNNKPVNVSSGKPKKFKTLGIIGGIILVIIAISMFLNRQVDIGATVTDVAWEYTASTEKYQEVYENDWNLPPGSRLESTSNEIHHYEEVLDHYEERSREVPHEVFDGYDTEYRDLGNGQYESYEVERYRTEYETEYYEEPVYRNEPVYQTKYYYYIDKWMPDEQLKTAAHDHEPHWHENMPAADVANPQYGDLRCIETEEKYWLYYDNGDSQEVDKAKWDTTFVGDKDSYKTTWIKARKLKKNK